MCQLIRYRTKVVGPKFLHMTLDAIIATLKCSYLDQILTSGVRHSEAQHSQYIDVQDGTW